MIDSDLLGTHLTYRPDPNNSSHGFIEPSNPMILRDFQTVLAATQSLWRRVP